MMWWGGWWFPGFIVLALFMFGCMGMIGHRMGHGSHSHGSRRHSPAPERILAKRLASGAIDIDEYERLRDALQQSSESTRTEGSGGHDEGPQLASRVDSGPVT